MKQSAAVMTPDFWLCYSCLGHSGKLPSCWKQLGKLPEVQRVAQVGALMAVRLQNLWQGSPEYGSCDLKASKHYPAGLFCWSSWQGGCPMRNVGRWVCSSISGKVEGNHSCFQQESACLGKTSHHFCEILIHQYSAESCFSKTFTSNC